MNHTFTRSGVRSMYLLPLFMIICSLQGAWAQCNLSLSEVHTDVSCYGMEDGTLTITISGGIAPYTIDETFETITTNSIHWSMVMRGDYPFTITDANGCTASIIVNIAEPAAPLSLSVQGTDVSCFEGSNGKAVASATGGTAPYTYSWDTYQVSGPVFNNLPAGYYAAVVLDAHGCGEYSGVSIGQPEPVSANVISSQPASCYGVQDGEVVVRGTGGSGPYLYSGSSSTIVTGLWPDYNSILITDANGCEGTVDVFIDMPQELFAMVASSTDVSCASGNDGTVTLAAFGGTAPYEYGYWSAAEGVPVYGSSPVVGGLSVGDQFLEVKDAHGCTTSVTTTIYEPQELTGTVLSYTDISCHGDTDGSVTLQASGGTESYLYNGSSSPLIEGLAADDYTIEITDAHGCTVLVQHTVADIMPLELSTFHSDATCLGGNQDGMLIVNAQGGTPAPDYTYEWVPGGWTYPWIENVFPGTYTVIVTDSHGCQATATETVGSEICEDLALVPTAISANSDGQNDTFRVLADDVGSVQLNVYDMFGKPVFSTTDVKAATETGWDGRCQGKDAPEGWYIWTLQGTYTNGKPLTPQGGQRGRLVLSR